MTSQQLFDQCSQILNGHYPASMHAIKAQVPGPGFFPGTSGFFDSGSLSDDVRKPYMFVGQDFGTAEYLPYLLSHPLADVQEGTGRILKSLLGEAGIEENDCFFTNALFGVRVSDKITGLCEGWKDPTYVSKCKEAFERQLAEVQPQAIVCLGGDAPRMLSLLFASTKHWQQLTYAQIDQGGHSILDVSGHASVRAAGILVHPSFHHANVWRRKFKGFEGRAAEIEILKTLARK